MPLIVLGIGAAVVVLVLISAAAMSGGGADPRATSSSTSGQQPAQNPTDGSGEGSQSQQPTVSPSSLGYAQEYQGIQFTIPRPDCAYNNSVTFNAQGPKVDVGTFSGDLSYSCDQSSTLLQAEGNQVALVDTQPDGPGCVQAVNLHPLDGKVPFANMHEGMQLCLVNTSSKQVVYLKLVTKASSAAITWSATGWNLPSASN